MSKPTTKPLAVIVDEIMYPDIFFEGLEVTAIYSLNGKKMGRTVKIAEEAPDQYVKYAINKFVDELIRAKSKL